MPEKTLTREEMASQARVPMVVSLAVGILMLVGKTSAYLFTGSAAILSDAMESVIHVVAVAFATFSLRLSFKPPDERFLYGYERIGFFSAGFEGAMIVLAAISIIFAAVRKWMFGIELQRLGAGTLVVLAAALVNLALGWYLVSAGRRTHSFILEADGKHVLTDSWTSFGVVAGLGLVLWTGWKPFDPLLAIAVALNILWSGGGLIARSVRGLMDFSDPAMRQKIQNTLDALCAELGLKYHGVRFRSTGYRLIIECHLLFPYDLPIGEAHRRATNLEERLTAMLEIPAEVVTHLEALEDHGVIHRPGHHQAGTGS